MTEILYSDVVAEQLRGKVVVITGGAQGIGAATVSQLHKLGARVFFGDWDREKGELHERDLLSNSNVRGGSVNFRQPDVRSYQSQLDLFDAAYREHGRVDVAISCAAVAEPGGWFEPEDLDLESVRREPLPLYDLIDIDLTSVIGFARIALAYMKASSDCEQREHSFLPLTPTSSHEAKAPLGPSIVLLSSIAGIMPSPGIFAYTAAKHGIVGLMRGLAA